jgi:hypothetical protein
MNDASKMNNFHDVKPIDLQDNRKVIGEVMDLIKDGLVPFVETQMRAKYSDQWVVKASEALPEHLRREFVKSDVPPWDVSSLVGVLYSYWNEIFQTALKGVSWSVLNKIRNVRNGWAHQKSFSSNEIYEALGDAERLLKAAQAAAQAKKIEVTKMEIWRLFDTREQKAVRVSTEANTEEAQNTEAKLPACWRCGTALADKMRFCSKCGLKVDRFVAGYEEDKDKVVGVGNNEPPMRTKATRRVWLAAALVMLVLIGTGASWYIQHHTSVDNGANSQNAPSVASTKQSIQTVPVKPTSIPVSKTAAKTSQTVSPISTTSTNWKLLHNQLKLAVASNSSKLNQTGSVSDATPDFQASPPSPSSRSGMLHYNGNSVPYGGTVTFDDLPKERLKFSYDKTAWRIIVRLNADGTKKVILNSIKPGLQTSCNLGWQVVE